MEGEEKEELGTSLLGSVRKLTCWVRRSSPPRGGLREDVRRADGFSLFLPGGRSSSSVDQGMSCGRRKE